MFDNMSKVTQGSAGLGIAIGHFCSKGIVVSLPLVDNQDYDLIIDEDGKLKKVQVKTTGTKSPSGNYEVQIKSVRSNKTINKIKSFDPNAVDYLFVLCGDGSKYLFPSNEITVKGALTLTPERVKYKV